MVHLNGRRYADRAYDATDVEAYSNAASVRLSAGSRDLGEAKCADRLCVWRGVRLPPGETVLTAAAQVDGKPVTDSVTWHYSGQPEVFNIRAGASAGALVGGKRFGSDTFVKGGEQIDRHPQPGPENPDPQIPAVGEGDQSVLYQTYREGKFAYTVPVAPGRYHVTVRFFEPNARAAGERSFDLTANGKKILTGYDIFATAGGAMKPAAAAFTVDAGKKGLDLDFVPVKGKAIVSAIEIQPEP